MGKKNDISEEIVGGALPSVEEGRPATGAPAEGPILPAAAKAQGAEALPSAAPKVQAGRAPAAEKAPAREAPEEETPRAASLAERIAAATRAGGLRDLPADFGDTGGGWESVLSENPFEVLFLDFRQISAITPRMVEVHRSLLRGFWQEKMKILSQGAGRVAIARKYGGQNADENQVRTYPDRIENAFHQLSTAGGMERVYLEIVHRREEKAIAEIKARLADFLIDGALHPRETIFLFELADQLELGRAVVADLIDAEVRRLGLKSQGVPSGRTLEEQLKSVVWSASAPNGSAVPAPARRSGGFPLLSVAALVLALILVGWLVGRSWIPEMPSPVLSPGTSGNPASPQNPPSGGLSKPANKPEEKRRVAKAPEAPAPSRPALENKAEERREEMGDLRRKLEQDQREALARIEQENAAKIELERNRRWEEQIALLADFERQENFEAALTLSEKLLAEALLPEPLALRAREMAQNATAGLERKRMAEWSRRLAEVEELFKKGIYTETRTKADLLAAEPEAPPAIVERAQKLAVDAVEALRADWSKTKAKSTTVRSKNGRPNGVKNEK